MTPTVYNYNKEGEYTGPSDARLDPKHSNRWLLPNNATWDEPPFPWCVWEENKWTVNVEILRNKKLSHLDCVVREKVSQLGSYIEIMVLLCALARNSTADQSVIKKWSEASDYINAIDNIRNITKTNMEKSSPEELEKIDPTTLLWPRLRRK